jgi:hypothetical protein
VIADGIQDPRLTIAVSEMLVWEPNISCRNPAETYTENEVPLLLVLMIVVAR